MRAPVTCGAAMRQVAALAVMPAAATVVHELRYVLAFGGRATLELQHQGHAYLHSVARWIVLLLALAVGVFLRALGRAFSGQCSPPRYTLSLAALWLTCSACLVAIYVSQESLEGLFATGHPAGIGGIFGYGGWWSVPAALCVGLVLAAALHGARRVLHEVARRCARQVAIPSGRTTAARSPRALLAPRLVPLADGWSGRGPPA